MMGEDYPFERTAIAERVFGEAEIRAYAAVTGDHNPIHCDAAFAAKTEFGQTIVHGTLVIAPLWHHLSAELSDALQHDVRFIRPTPVGATVSYWQRHTADGREFAARLADGTIVATIVERRR